MPASTLAPGGPRRALAVTLVGLAVVAVALFLFWPLGVVLGLAVGVLVVLGLGQQQERAARTVPVEDLFGLEADAPRPVRSAALLATTAPVDVPTAARAPIQPQPQPQPQTVPEAQPAAVAAVAQEQGVRADLDRLKAQLGDDYRDFARAAHLVVSTQYASAARLQRDLQLPYSRARRLLADLESEHFVGPATGTLPRQVLLPKERLPEVEEMLAGV